MIRVDLLLRFPMYLIGTKAAFVDSGFTVVGARTSSREQPSWFADVYVVELNAVVDPSPEQFVETTARLSPTIVIAEQTDANSYRKYLGLGALSVLNVDSPSHSFVEAVRCVNSGQTYLADPLSEVIPAEAEDLATAQPGLDSLSPRELQVLHYIAKGMTHSQISRRLDISHHTVDTYVKRIRAKIGAGNKAELTRACMLGQLQSSSLPAT